MNGEQSPSDKSGRQKDDGLGNALGTEYVLRIEGGGLKYHDFVSSESYEALKERFAACNEERERQHTRADEANTLIRALNASSAERSNADHAEVLRGMIAAAVNGRCYACGWPFDTKPDPSGCTLGDCSYRPSEQHPDYPGWHKRVTEMLAAQTAASVARSSEPATKTFTDAGIGSREYARQCSVSHERRPIPAELAALLKRLEKTPPNIKLAVFSPAVLGDVTVGDLQDALSAIHTSIPDVLFDSYAVYKELRSSDATGISIPAVAVVEVLDAAVRLMRRDDGKAER